MAKDKNAPLRLKNVVGTKHLYDNVLSPENVKLIEKNIPKTLKIMKKHIIDMGSDLSTKGPEKRIKFNKTHEIEFIESTGVDIESIKTGIKDCEIIREIFVTMNNPFYSLISLMIAHFYNNDIKVGKIEVAKTLNLYLTIRAYKARFGTSFPYPPSSEVMDYTITHLKNNKYNIRKHGTMFKTLVYLSDSHYDNFSDVLENNIDDYVIYYVSNIYNRVSRMLVTIAREFFKNHDAGKGTGIDKMQNENGEGETYLETADNVSNLIAINSRKIYLNFIADSIVSPKILKNACNNTRTSYSKMMITMGKILESKDEEIEKIFIVILSYYYTNGGKVIKSPQFITDMIEMYKTSNTTNDYIKELKDLLGIMMDKYSEQYRLTSRASTLSDMKKTLFLYLVYYAVNTL